MDATVARVVARAGVSRRTFYELFDDREDCFLAGFDEGIAQASRYVLDTYDPEAGWAERLRLALAALLSFLDVERGAGQLLVVGSLGAGASALDRRQRVLAQMITAVDVGRTLTGTPYGGGQAGKGAKAGSPMRGQAELSPLIAEGIVGGVLSVIHARMIGGDRPLIGLLNPLMSMIVLPYLGSAVARKELERPAPTQPRASLRNGADPFKGLPIRFTYRTARVLSTIATEGGRGSYPSNRHIADSSGIADEGQMSRLLRRLDSCGLIENRNEGHTKGEPNAWTLTPRGEAIHATISRAASA